MFKDEFFKVSSYLQKKSSTLLQKSEKAIDTAQQKISDSRIEFRINNKKIELGDMVYNQYCNNEMDSEKVAELCEEIRELERQLKTERKENRCLECNTLNQREARYCSKCGTVLNFASGEKEK